MNLTMKQVAAITKGELLQGDDSAIIEYLVLDSRKALQAEHGLFIAIHGVRHNSHTVIPDLYGKGLRCFLVEENIALTGLENATFVKVSNSIAALQLLAAYQRAQCRYPVVGITGSNGKTIVKEWLNVMLSDDYRIVRSPKSYNSQIGVPISVWNMDETHQLGLFEAGISEPAEMEKLAKVIQPTIGILTTIGTAHMENFLSRRQLIGEKLHLFARAETIIVPDDADVLQLVNPWSESIWCDNPIPTIII
jgi:Alr-MurF fusion protein